MHGLELKLHWFAHKDLKRSRKNGKRDQKQKVKKAKKAASKKKAKSRIESMGGRECYMRSAKKHQINKKYAGTRQHVKAFVIFAFLDKIRTHYMCVFIFFRLLSLSL